MKRILIADSSKASLVMTSEVFKDHFPGVQVVVARTSAEAIELAKTCGEVDAFVVDFDLPDRDGAYTAARIKRFSQTPVLITAFDRPDVHDSIERELAAFDDCLSWLRKPVKADVVVAVAQRFVEGRFRCQRRIECRLPAFLEATVTITTLVQVEMAAATRRMAIPSVRAAKAPASKPAKSASGKAQTTKKQNAKGTHSGAAQVKSAAPKSPKSAQATKTAKSSKSTKDASTPDTRKSSSSRGTEKPLTTATMTGRSKAPASKDAPNKDVKETKKAAPKVELVERRTEARVLIPVVIEDSSVGGVRIRVTKRPLLANPAAVPNMISSDWTLEAKIGETVTLFAPSFEDIIKGQNHLDAWARAVTESHLRATQPGQSATAGKSKAKAPTLSTLQSTTKAAAGSKNAARADGQATGESNLVSMKAKIAWGTEMDLDRCLGLQAENAGLAKRLFEGVLEITGRTRSSESSVAAPTPYMAPTPAISVLDPKLSRRN